MAKNAIPDYDGATPGNNTDIAGINTAEGWALSNVNNAFRQLMSDIKDYTASLPAIGGAADVYTFSFGQVPTAYVTGLEVIGVVGSAITNTGAATLNVNSLGAKNIKQRNGSDPIAGQIQSDRLHTFRYDGTNFVLLDPRNFEIGSVQVFTASGTWTRPAGCVAAKPRGVGGGGAGGGNPATAAGQCAAGSGGGGGGYFEEFITSGLGATETITIGAGGTGVSAGNGNNGGTTSFGSHCQATGGTGGQVGVASSGANGRTGALGGVGSGGDVDASGGNGHNGYVVDGTNGLFASGGGGASIWGTGGSGLNSFQVGQPPPNGYGGGGGGSGSTASQSPSAGGAGRVGYIIVEEYY